MRIVGLFRKEKTEPVLAVPDRLAGNLAPATNPAGPSAKKEKTVSLKTDEITTILGKGSEFEGKLQFEGTLRIEGVYSGQIMSDSILVVGEGARVNAEIEIGTIIVNGQVQGNIRAKQGVEIRGHGRVTGNLETPALYVEKGVVFEGNCKMENLGSKAAPIFPKTDKPKEELKDKK
jgi:cytoskeletal protein CcmA (bactofilin family)